MLDGTQFAAELTSQYPVIEKTFAQVDSELSKALRKSLEQLYAYILRFMLRAIVYFDPKRKTSRALTGLNPVSADENKKLRDEVTQAMAQVDHDLALCHAEVTQRGINEVLAGQSKQNAITVDGILALARNTGTAMREQKSLLIEKFHAADAQQSERIRAVMAQITQQWQGPLEVLVMHLAKERIEREKKDLVEIRRWLSTAQPEQDHEEARSKRPMKLGDWFLKHPKFVDWRKSNESSIFWLYGLPGTGKTNLSGRVIDSLQDYESRADKDKESVFLKSSIARQGHTDSAPESFVDFTSPNVKINGHALLNDPREIYSAPSADETKYSAAAKSNDATSTAIDRNNSLELPNLSSPTVLAFFYCSNDKTEKGREEVFSRSDPEEMLRSIVSQIATRKQDRNIAPALRMKYTEYGPASNKQRILNYVDCRDITLAIAADVGIIIIIDALDECDHGKCLEVIDKLKGMLDQSSSDPTSNAIKIFIATRSFPGIENELTSRTSLEVTAENNREDVKRFISTTLEERSKDLLGGTASDHLKAEIRDTLSRRAQSMFLYASLLLNQLCDRNHFDDEESVRRKLDQLPKNLKDVYDKVLLDVHDDKNNSPRLSHIAQNTFKWLLQSQRSLDRDTLLEAVSSVGGRATPDEVRRSCRTLVVEEKMTFNFAHHSIREYLEQRSEYSPSLCHLTATHSCLRILNKSFESEESGREISKSERRFKKYALFYWPMHYEGVIIDETDNRWDTINISLRGLLLQSYGKTNRYTAWLSQARELDQEFPEDRFFASRLDSLQATPPTPLFAACVFGIPGLIGRFGRDLHNLNQCNVYGESALCLAVVNKKISTVKALLSRRFPADVNLLNVKAVAQFEGFDPESHHPMVHYASPLQAAAACGHREIAEYLLEKGAHMELVAGYFGNALQAAALNGHEEIVALLLNRGAEPNSQGGFYRNALQAAAAKGHSGVVNLLLENNRPPLIDTPGGPYGSALMAAVCSGNSEATWILIDEGADTNNKDVKLGYPLEQAASRGFKDIVSLLLTVHAKADLSPRDSSLHLLHHAAIYGMIDLAEYCLENGCSIDMMTTAAPKYFTSSIPEDPRTMTPLALACGEGQTEMVRYLIRRGSTLDIGDVSSSALWVAVRRGQADIVQLLVDQFEEKCGSKRVHEFVSRCPPQKGHPMLFIAVVGGSQEVVRKLLFHRTRYDNNWYDASPLIATATFNRPQIAQDLVDHSDQGKINGKLLINGQARNGRTALFEAIAMSHKEVARVLLTYGADWTIANDILNTPLHILAHEGDDHIFAAYLLEKAYKGSTTYQFSEFLNAKNKAGSTALMHAARFGRQSYVALLLEYGADWSLSCNPKETALHIACWEGREAVVALLLDTAPKGNKDRFFNFLNQRNEQGKTALIDSIERKRLPLVKQLLHLGANYTIPNIRNETALHYGCYRGHEDSVKRVLETGSRDPDQSRFSKFLDARNEQGKTALCDACQTDRPSLVKSLLKHGANYTLEDNNGLTALHYCMFGNNRASLSTLLEIASTDKIDNGLRFKRFLNHRCRKVKASALRDAAIHGHDELVDLLLNTYGADYTSVGINKCTPLHIAVQKNFWEVFRIVLDHAWRDEDVQRFHEFLLMKDKDGNTAWMNACERRDERMKTMLKAKWADVR